MTATANRRWPALGRGLSAFVVASAVACGRDSGRSELPPGSGSAVPGSAAMFGAGMANCKDEIDSCAADCDAGAAERCRRLAASFDFGEGALRDEARAATLYERACDLGDAAACVFAGRMHEYAHGVTKDDARAAAFYERACTLGWAGGCYNLAIVVESGRGVPRDAARATDLYDAACRAGSGTACAKAKALREQVALDAAAPAQKRVRPE